MAFRDTSERYEYIYGSNVKKLDRETAGSTKSGSPKRAGNTAVSYTHLRIVRILQTKRNTVT